ncbi:hypothetical protein [Lentzea flava]|nr:hypothetical protein [Lentzea flava]
MQLHHGVRVLAGVRVLVSTWDVVCVLLWLCANTSAPRVQG